MLKTKACGCESDEAHGSVPILADAIRSWNVTHCGQPIQIEDGANGPSHIYYGKMTTWAHCQHCGAFVDPNALFTNACWYSGRTVPFIIVGSERTINVKD